MARKRRPKSKSKAKEFCRDERLVYLEFDLLDQEVAEFKANDELDKAREAVKQAKKFFQKMPMGDVRTLCLETLRKNYYGYSKVPIPDLQPYLTQVAEDPIGKRFSDDCLSFDDFGFGGWREKQ